MTFRTYPDTPDLTIAVGDDVISYDFPGNTEYLIIGNVTRIHNELYEISGRMRVTPDELKMINEVITVPVNGLEGFFGLTRGVIRRA